MYKNNKVFLRITDFIYNPKDIVKYLLLYRFLDKVLQE